MKKAYLVSCFLSTRVVSEQNLITNRELAWEIAENRLITNLRDQMGESLEIRLDIECPYGTLPTESEEFFVAQAVKNYLIQLALDDSLPADLNQLRIDDLIEVINHTKKLMFTI